MLLVLLPKPKLGSLGQGQGGEGAEGAAIQLVLIDLAEPP